MINYWITKSKVKDVIFESKNAILNRIIHVQFDSSAIYSISESDTSQSFVTFLPYIHVSSFRHSETVEVYIAIYLALHRWKSVGGQKGLAQYVDDIKFCKTKIENLSRFRRVDWDSINHWLIKMEI